MKIFNKPALMLGLTMLAGAGTAAQAGSYTVVNYTGNTIYWQDGGWYSGEVGVNQLKNVPSDHDAYVTLYMVVNGQGVVIGRTVISKRQGCVRVHGIGNWHVEQGLSSYECRKGSGHRRTRQRQRQRS